MAERCPEILSSWQALQVTPVVYQFLVGIGLFGVIVAEFP
jgi:hypothetical protein